MDTNIYYWLWYRGLRMHLGQWRERQYRDAKRRWRQLNPPPTAIGCYVCAICGLVIPPREFSIDHIVSINEIIERGLDISLIWSTGNFQPAHQLCNTLKADHPSTQPASP